MAPIGPESAVSESMVVAVIPVLLAFINALSANAIELQKQKQKTAMINVLRI